MPAGSHRSQRCGTLRKPASGPPQPKAAQESTSSPPPAHAVDGAAWVGRRSGDVEPAQRRPVAKELRSQSEDELLVELVRAAREVAADEARVLALGLRGRARRPREHERPEARR